LVIYGHGDNTILQAADGIIIFNITCTASCLIKTLRLDISNYTTDTQAVLINETNNNIVGFEDVSIIGGAANGIGIEVQSDNCYIEQCNILQMKTGIYLNGAEKTRVSGTLSRLHVNYGLHLNLADYSIITGNSFTANTIHGIYIFDSDYCIISNTGCTSNLNTGIYSENSSYNTISSNLSNSNSLNGLYITQGNYNTISSNTFSNNDSNVAGDTAGLFMGANCDYNTITGNSCNNNNNIGTGDGYGIIISAATSNENVVVANNFNGNDIDVKDAGTQTIIIYYVQSRDEFQDAIDSIGTRSGTIVIPTGEITLDAELNINGGGDYTIQGEGVGTVLTTVGEINLFNITNVKSCTFKNFKVDVSSLGVDTTPVFNIVEGSDIGIVFSFITIVGDGSNGIGFELTTNNNIVNNCNMSSLGRGIRLVTSNNNIITNNVISTNQFDGITFGGSSFNLLANNIINDNGAAGISVNGSDNNINGNTCNDNDDYGIYLLGSDNNILSNNICYGNNSNSGGSGGGIWLHGTSDDNIIIGNTLYDNNNAGGGTGYGLRINAGTNDNNIVGVNMITGNDTNYSDIGTGTILLGDNTAYGAGWNGDLGTATKNAIYDKIQSLALAAHLHDGDVLQLDGIDSNGGVFAFATTNSIGIDMVNAGATVFSITNSGAGVASLDITGNITVSGTVDGVDIADRDHAPTVGGDLTHDSITFPNGNANEQHLTAAQVATLHTILDGYTKAELNGGQLDDRYYTETELDAINAIGIANKRWKLTAYKGAFAYASSHNYINVQNVGGTDMILTYEVLLPPTIGTKNLIITDTRISIPDSENSDYVNAVAMYGRLASGGWDAANWTVDHDVVYGKGIGIFTYGHADITIGGVYKGVSLLLTCFNTNARRLDIGNLEVEYYYG